MTRHEDQPISRTQDADEDEPFARAGALLIGLLAEASLVHETLVQWLRHVADHCEIIRFTSAESMAAQIAAGTRFDLVLIGDFLKATAGETLVVAARIIGGAGGDCPIIVVSASADVRMQRDLLGCGVRGHIPTSMSPSAAAEAVRLVLAGGTYSQVNEGALAQRPHRWPGEAVGGADRLRGGAPEVLVRQKLSPREFQVLSLLEHGYSNRRISAELGISENTVMVHLRHLMRKLGATNRTQAVFKANCLLADPGAGPDL